MSNRRIVARADAMQDRATIKFCFQDRGQRKEGFVIRAGDRFFAYRNECRHIPVTMDWVENRFLSRDGCHLQCATHGALYEIESGLCIDGPPAGEMLRRLPVEVIDGDVVVTLPE